MEPARAGVRTRAERCLGQIDLDGRTVRGDPTGAGHRWAGTARKRVRDQGCGRITRLHEQGDPVGSALVGGTDEPYEAVDGLIRRRRDRGVWLVGLRDQGDVLGDRRRKSERFGQYFDRPGATSQRQRPQLSGIDGGQFRDRERPPTLMHGIVAEAATEARNQATPPAAYGGDGTV